MADSKFKNSSFHREGKPKPKPKSNPTASTAKSQPKSTQSNSEFIKELVETGRANWTKAPKAVKQRYNGIFLILFSIPVLALSTFEMVRRLEGKSTKKIRQGEVLDNQDIRKYDEREKWQVEKNSLMYKIFGRDFFLDGFTSKTMHESNDKKD